jgi:hypothetical protein
MMGEFEAVGFHGMGGSIIKEGLLKERNEIQRERRKCVRE